MTNAQSARDWLLKGLGGDAKAVANISWRFQPMPRRCRRSALIRPTGWILDWVGGRYSMDSAIGLSTMLPSVRKTSRVAERVSRDGRTFPHGTVREKPASADGTPVDLEQQLPRRAPPWAVLPYEQYLKTVSGVPAAVDDGEQRQTCHARREERSLPDGANLLGEPGTNGQHSFYQLIHQGTRLIPCDFIAFAHARMPLDVTMDILMANVFAQAEALAFGKTPDEVKI